MLLDLRPLLKEIGVRTEIETTEEAAYQLTP